MDDEPRSAALTAVLTAIDRVDDLVHGAPPVPLTEQVRLDPDALGAAVGELRAAAAALPATADPDARHRLAEGVAALGRLVAEAPRMPFGRAVRLGREVALDALDEVRAALSAAARGAGDRGASDDPLVRAGLAALDAVDRLDDLTHRARHVPLTDQVRLDPVAFRAGLADVRAGTAALLADEARVSHRPLTDGLEALERLIGEAPDLPVGGEVRLRRAPMYAALDAFRAELPEALARRRR